MLASLSKSELRFKALESKIQVKVDSGQDTLNESMAMMEAKLNATMEVMIAKHFESLKPVQAGNFTMAFESKPNTNDVKQEIEQVTRT